MNCKICEGELNIVFTKNILAKYPTKYYKCVRCGFIQTDNPFWLKEAYSDAISDMDTGIFVRNSKYCKIVPLVILAYFKSKAKFLDYGAGYGIFVRMMRDKGFDFYWQDEYCQNLFAKKYDAGFAISNNEKFELITAFEVFEHLVNPLEEVDKMLRYSDSILFSTNLIPSESINQVENWWYISEETGQHIAFYSLKSLEMIAAHFKLNLYSNGNNFHLLTKKNINSFLFSGLKVFKSLTRLFKKENHTTGAENDRQEYKSQKM